MYEFRDDVELNINKAKAGREIGVTRSHLTNILNRKKLCPKVLAFCITKYLNANAEIQEYFIRKDK